MIFIAGIVGILVLGWFLRRLFPALATAAVVLLAPLWLVGGAVLDVLRKVAAVCKIKRPGPPG